MENLKPELLTLAALAACSIPESDINRRDDVVNPDHGNGVYAYTDFQEVNEELHSLYREFLAKCEAEGSGATLSEIAKDRDELLLNNGCEMPIRWVCNDAYRSRANNDAHEPRPNKGQMGERIKIPTPFSCQAPRRVQNRASK